MYSFFRDVGLLYKRQMRLSLNVPAYYIFGLIQPVLYLAFFAPLLKSIAGAGLPGFPSGSSYKFFVPGLLVQLGLVGASLVGFTVLADLRYGVLERMRVTPVSRLALLLSRVLRDVTMQVGQAAILIAAAFAFGLRAPAVGIVIALCFVAILATSLAAMSYSAALLLKSEDAFAPIFNVVVIPMMLLSGIMLPMTLAPNWLNWVSRCTPFRYVIEAMRSAFQGHYASTLILEGTCVAVGLAALCLFIGARAFQREIA